MMEETELRINLGSLKRQDPYIDRIVDSSTHVAIYSFSPELNEWEKTEIEGTLFVYQRVAPPYWGFTIMNRLNMNNLTEPLTSELEFQTQNPFLLYRNARSLIFGIWFYNQEGCRRIGALLERLCKESNKKLATDTTGLQHINVFGDRENNLNNVKDSGNKSRSPTSNSVKSISPESSVEGLGQNASNGEADSESEDKDVTRNIGKGGVDILDLLSKAQNKFEKENRSTPDSANDALKNGSKMNKSDPQIIKPVPLKPTHPQKLDVATLFKQHPPKLPEPYQNQTMTNAMHSTIAMNPDFSGMGQHSMTPVIVPSTSAPSMNRNTRQLNRSFSMTEFGMRKSMEPFMNNNFLSVEEVEAGLNKKATAEAERQSKVNSALDKMIDRINSSNSLLSSGRSAQTSSLPGIQETKVPDFAIDTRATAGNSGSLVTNSNKAIYTKGDVFTTNTVEKPYAGTSICPPQRNFSVPTASRMRSASSSALPQSEQSSIPVKNNFGLGNAHLQNNFPLVPNLPVNVTSTVSAANHSVSSSSASTLLHGNVVTSLKGAASHPPGSPTASSLSSIPKVNAASKILPALPASSPVVQSSINPTTLISPEDFERSAATPQKKLALQQILLQDAPKKQPLANHARPSPLTDPLTKDQLQQAIITLLEKDDSFLSAIHNAYLAKF